MREEKDGIYIAPRPGDAPSPVAPVRPISDEPSRAIRSVASRTESPIRGAALSRRSETTHPFLIRGGDIGFTSTQGSSYDDACATYPISGTAQESDFSLSLHRLVYSSASSTSRAPTVHLGSNARKRPAKRSRLDRTRLDSTRLDSESRLDSRLSTLSPEGARPAGRSNAGAHRRIWKTYYEFPGDQSEVAPDSFAQWPRIVNLKSSPSLLSPLFVRPFPPYALICLLSRPALSLPLLPLLLLRPARAPGQAHRPQV